jgi:hypothetical protein
VIGGKRVRPIHLGGIIGKTLDDMLQLRGELAHRVSAPFEEYSSSLNFESNTPNLIAGR